MKQRLADYVADFLINHGVTDCFSVVGGGAMHLNDALGHKEGLKVTYNHHEQACAIAAEAYARLDNRIAAVCVTTGPGGTNALTGVVGGWLDSIPMFIISGQVRYDTTARYAMKFTDGMPLRAMGDQEYDIVKSVTPMTKYAVMIEDPKQIRYALEKAWHLATTGRPGPVWIDIPVNFQGGYIETEELEGYDPSEDDALLPPKVSEQTIQTVLEKIRMAKRPVFHAGYGIRLSGGYEVFRKVAEKLNLIDKDKLNFLWVVEFPLFEYDYKEKRISATHHPFTAPVPEDIAILESDTLKVRSDTYDLVLNGNEIGGGSVRIHQDDIQEKMFEVLGFTKEQANDQFGFLLDAFKYGVPPHAGLAYGLDRLIMLMAQEDSIREVIAFPKVKDASCLMSGAPGRVDEKQLKELDLEVKAPETEEKAEETTEE